jgi:hypothetical protein
LPNKRDILIIGLFGFFRFVFVNTDLTLRWLKVPRQRWISADLNRITYTIAEQREYATQRNERR